MKKLLNKILTAIASLFGLVVAFAVAGFGATMMIAFAGIGVVMAAIVWLAAKTESTEDNIIDAEYSENKPVDEAKVHAEPA